MIKILLVDDQTLMREGLRSMLNELTDDMRVDHEADDGRQALQLLQDHDIDMVLLDLQMPNMDGIEVLKAMAEQQLQVPTIVLTTFDDQERLIECTKLGARGFLLKDVGLKHLISTIKRVMAGDTCIQPTVTMRILEGLQKDPLRSLDTCKQPEKLTKREHEILRYMAGGYSNKEIARAISLTEGTVRNHVSNILAKFAVRDRTRAVMKALDFGLLA